MIIEKKCTKCGKVKPIDNFRKRKSGKDGYRCQCNKCYGDVLLRWREKNKEKIKIQKKKYREDNRGKIRIQLAIWRRENSESIKKYKKDNICTIRVKNKEWRRNNPENVKRHDKKHKLKYRATIKGQLNSRMGSGMRDALEKNKKGFRWECLVGYDVNALKSHLEKQFTDEMSWEAFMDGKIHIDHIKPLASFNYVTIMDEQFRQCWAMENLQPLWAKDNFSKGCRV